MCVHFTSFSHDARHTHTQALRAKKLEDELGQQKAAAEKALEASRAETARALWERGKLESLSRELQKKYKAVTEESRRAVEEDQAKRAELSKSFRETIHDITAKMEEQGEERKRLMHENDTLREQFQAFVEQYRLREQHHAAQLKAKDVARLLAEAKLKQQTELCVRESVKGQAYLVQINDLVAVEKSLRTQVSLYSQKFEQFQETLSKSNEVFASFRARIDDMNTAAQKLEHENAALRKKSDESDVTLFQFAEENGRLKQQLQTALQQKKSLEDLCRYLQSQRSTATTSTSPPAPAPAPAAPPDAPPAPDAAPPAPDTQ